MTIPGRTVPGISGIIIAGPTLGSAPGIIVPGTMTPGMTTGHTGTAPGVTITTSVGAFISIRPGLSGTIPFTVIPGIIGTMGIMGSIRMWEEDTALSLIPGGVSAPIIPIRAISRQEAGLPDRPAAVSRLPAGLPPGRRPALHAHRHRVPVSLPARRLPVPD